MREIIGYYERVVKSISQRFNLVAACAIFAMMVLTCTDVVMRYFGRPIPGCFDVIRLLSVVAIAFAMAYIQVQRGHTSVELVTSHLSARSKKVVDSIAYLLSLGLFILLARESFVYARRLWLANEVFMTLKMPIFPLVYVIAIGSILLCLVLLADIIKSFKKR
jgi:TRAP-type C4-dicarboxylate transport system permease small subunit